MTAGEGPGPRARSTSIVRRLLHRVAAARSAHLAGRTIAGLVARPPASLAALERLVGRLDVDMAGPEGRGAGVFRPNSPFAPGGMTGDVRVGALRPGIVRLFAGFDYDMYHGLPRRAEQLRPNQVSVSVDLGRDEVRKILERALGSPRVIDRDGRAILEFGRWYYVEPWDRPATLAWEERQPDWALPPVPSGAAEAFVAALVATLRGHSGSAEIAAAVSSLGAAAGARVTGSGSRLSVAARPGLPLPVVVAAFGWDEPVAWSPDVHMATWVAGPREPVLGGRARTRIGNWLVETWLDGAPAGATALAAAGPSTVYDLRGHPGPVIRLLATPADGDDTPD